MKYERMKKILYDIVFRNGVNIGRIEYVYSDRQEIIVNGVNKYRVPRVDAAVFVNALLDVLRDVFGDYKVDGEKIVFENAGLAVKIMRYDKYNAEAVFEPTS